MMNLSDIYEKEGISGLRKLAEAADTSADYLYQLATGFRNRNPSPALAKRLVKADPRLTLESIYRDVEKAA